MSITEQINARQEYNFKILDELKLMVEKYPDLRFMQILDICFPKSDRDPFYDESYKTYHDIVSIKNNIE